MSASRVSARHAIAADLAALTSGQPLDRRRFFASAAAAGVTAIAGDAFAQGGITTAALDASSWRTQRLEPRRRPGFAKDLTNLIDLNGTNQGMAYWRQTTLLTPTSDFFIRNEYPTPLAEADSRVDPAKWRLKIHGDAIERPLEITYDDLLRMPSKSLISTLECAGNGRSLFWEQQDMTSGATTVSGTGWTFGGIGMAEWQYVPMSYILGLVGLKPNAKACLFWSGVDGKKPGTESDTGRPIPIQALIQRGDAIGLAFKMNGRDLTPDHGAPVRALVPGYCGAASTKWLTEIKIASHDFWVPLNVTRHVMFGPDYVKKAPKPQPNDEFRFVTASQIRGVPVTWSPPRSMMTIPLVLAKQPKHPHNYPLQPGELPKLRAEPQMMHGYAWAPQWGVKQIEVRVNGRAWQKVAPVDPISSRYRWTRFEFPWHPLPGRHSIETRVTDGLGIRQPESVPFNEGGFNFWAVPKFFVEAV